MVALIDIEMGDAAQGGGADVHVGLGLDLAGAVDEETRFSRDDLPMSDFGIARLRTHDGEPDHSGENQDDSGNNEELFQDSCSLAKDYASSETAVPRRRRTGCVPF